MTIPKYFIGIDPGAEGGAAKIDSGRRLINAVSFKNKSDAELAELFKTLLVDDCYVVIEKVHSMPGQGVQSMFNFGLNTGKLHGIVNCWMLDHRNIVFDQVDPSVWKRFLRLKAQDSYTKRKQLTKARASELYPGVKMTHQTAEAVLLAVYAYEKYLLNLA